MKAQKIAMPINNTNDYMILWMGHVMFGLKRGTTVHTNCNSDIYLNFLNRIIIQNGKSPYILIVSYAAVSGEKCCVTTQITAA